ncbi:histidine kinase [Leptospira yanagawae serovar Saopaulo str. Sao Paulo = ATCC 700523]|uniref:histidine kinase n=1 Tax=Leptospira yanagawae serovar Saopaulo str. Sao Paulo = ATCC 700523 TaxID=1249483 RepID=A0A5E8HD37_9LEPT|nr:sensor histidine kinase [Leptospira yanagawae]EOQ88713.1 histidine kinase [Leptospira yanagawae serovar Saopaulo str. Sao Paulo = ATCC 700523]
MNAIVLLNLLSFIIYLIALFQIIVVLIRKPVFRGEGTMVLVLALIPCYVNISNIFEHGFSIDYFDDYEGFFKDLYAMFLLIYFYIHTIKKEQNTIIQHQSQIKSDLKLKSKLLTEIHHRVNNNLQIISGLMALQIESENDEKLTTSLNLIQNRINAIASVHKIIYGSPNLLFVNLNQIFSSILLNLKLTYLKENQNIELRELIEEGLEMDLDRAIPIGLILNELVSNSFRHAFKKEDKGIIEVSLGKLNDEFVLIIKDNGLGSEGELMEAKGIGIMLVKSLVKQIKGKIIFDSDHGMTAEIRFPLVNANPIQI